MALITVFSYCFQTLPQTPIPANGSMPSTNSGGSIVTTTTNGSHHTDEESLSTGNSAPVSLNKSNGSMDDSSSKQSSQPITKPPCDWDNVSIQFWINEAFLPRNFSSIGASWLNCDQ